MKNKPRTGAVACVLTLLILFTGIAPISASNAEHTVNEAYSIIDGILNHKLTDSGAEDVQSWINSGLTHTAGSASEWYIIALSRYGQYDFSSYEKALSDYLDHNRVASASSRQKYAMALIATQSKNSYVAQTMNDSIGKQGIMSWVYGLHLLNNGRVSDAFTTSDVIEQLVSLQCDDGGWAITGVYGDVDVTAMTVQALAPHYLTDTAVKASVNRALDLLSARQLDDGDYASYGVSNPESVAQVIVALSSLGIDPATDERFIKNGNTLIDGIGKYRLPDGSFCHTEKGASNENATAQVLHSMIAYLRLKNGLKSFYLFDGVSLHTEPPSSESDQPVPPPDSLPAKTPTSTHEVDGASEQMTDHNSQNSYKPWVCLIIVGIGGIACFILCLTGKRHFKNFIVVLIAVAVSVIFVCATDFQTADDYYNGEDAPKDNVTGTVKLTVRCDTIVELSDSEHIPSNGVILEMTEFEIQEGDTVYDILTEAARKYNIQLEYNGTAEMAYIVGINYLYEFDFGDLSGWVFRVNGEPPSVGCGEYTLRDGDTIEWHYSCALGNDIE